MECDMDHAEAREQVLDRALEPARLRTLETDTDPAAAELRAHLATCAACRAELEQWRGTFAALDLAVSADPADGGVPAPSMADLAGAAGDLQLPAGLRARALAAAGARTPMPVGPVEAPLRPAEARRRPVRLPALLAAAALVVVFVGGTAIVVDRSGQLDAARADAAALAGVTATLDGILRDPAHHVAALKTPAGSPAGSVSWSTADGGVVVLTSALQAPPVGQVYRCWVKEGGAGVVVGEMRFSGSTAYWAGSLAAWGYSVAPGTRFWVSLEPVGGGSGGTLVLDGTL